MTEDIIKVLLEAGDAGLRLRKIVLHVYNKNNTFFHPVSREEVTRVVTSFVRTHSKGSGCLLHRNSWGIYRINKNSAAWKHMVAQQVIHFSDDTSPLLSETPSSIPVEEKNQRSLFDG